ncbi:protein ENHANCED DOWNY MILDEW 2 isoform X1 [Arachis duranensis]|uniref:Protein ENHANCED DOWNY MILDEW 2 isoform X1 n=2 Tax=Arachis duranensis TaxID=130453 RepID=A0A6P4C308_ARADU|nr:protein ENHANCED DOWNY MILDEW 2 isoform X1 [Arachis duranensis]
MASSDDEPESHPLSVSNYHFEDDRDAPVSFSVMPIQWSGSESPQGKKTELFLHGVADNGLQKVMMPVMAWRFELSSVKPEISVLSSKDRRWIKLEKPRKSYEDIVRSILVTVYFLSFAKKNPDATAKAAWDSLSKNKEFSSYEVMPSANDLVNQKALMSEAAKRDALLAKSKLLPMALEGNLGAKKLFDEELKDLARPGFIIDDDVDDDMTDANDEESDEEDELFDSLCSICDDGGNLLCCDGKCMRSFHANKEDGVNSSCVSLGFSQKEVEDIPNFYCKNCEHNQHQCFACGKLGCSDKFSGAEVFQCASATCGYFYHPQCVVKLLHRFNENASRELETNISRGEPFTCPSHYCYVCKETENKKEHELQLAVCRRCPKSYHRKCLPRAIAFEDIEDEGIITRAWDNLIPNRVLIYCLKHDIDNDLGTPIRDHITFPNDKSNVQEASTEQKRKPATEERVMLNKNNVNLDNSVNKRSIADVPKLSTKVPKLAGKKSSGPVGIKKFNKVSGSNIQRKPIDIESSRKRLCESKRPFSKETERPDCEENEPSIGVQLYAIWEKGSGQTGLGNQVDNKASAKSVIPTRKPSSPLCTLDADSKRRLLDLFNEATSSVTLKDVVKERKFAYTHSHSLKNFMEKTTVGKLERSVEAVRTALKMLEDGRSIRDAEAVCGPDVLNQIYKWKDKLKVYLAPVLCGNRYTSFGRHFTQVEKLEGIVDRLHWYVQNGDTIVDFCCGANDFSILMKKKLEETGKRCSYKNYDLLPTKHDFCFEMRDWMTVQPKELPTGSQLIMGLNPPFGLKAALANKFIDKALEFRPKLLILIVPPETERLDKKRSRYDLVWEDRNFLSGKSFYLPGSINTSDRQMEQWNLTSPPLSLWSRPDWTDKHMEVAQKHGHLLSLHEVSRMESFNNQNSRAGHSMDGNFADDDMLVDDLLVSTDDLEVQGLINDDQQEISLDGNVERESQERHESWTEMTPNENVGRESQERHDYLMRKTPHGNVEQERHEDHTRRSPHEYVERESQERHDYRMGKSPHGIVERDSQERHEDQIGKSPHGNVERESQERHDHRMGKTPHGIVERERHDYRMGKTPQGIVELESQERHEDQIGKTPHGNVERESQERHDYRMGKTPHGIVERESQERHDYRMGKTKTSWNRKHTEENNRGGPHASSPAKSNAKNQTKGLPHRSQSNPKDGRSSVGGLQPKSSVSSPYGYGHLEPMRFGAASDYMASTFEEHHSSLLIDGTNTLGYNPYVGEDDSYLRQQPRLYGLQDPDSHYMTSNFLSGHDSVYGRMGSSYGVLGSGSESAYMMSTPAMQRYASRLDPRLDSFGSVPPMVGRNAGFEHGVPQPEYGSGMPSGMPGFAPQPQDPYRYPNSRSNSGSWFNG